MRENLELMRFYLVLLAVFTAGRWGLSLGGVEYDAAHQVFSIVILTNLAALHYGAFTRRFRGFPLKRAAALGASLGIVSQVVVVASTLLSYGLGVDSFFNAPRALNVEEPVGLGAAMQIRAVGFAANTITNTLAGAIGWALGAVLPRDSVGSAA